MTQIKQFLSNCGLPETLEDLPRELEDYLIIAGTYLAPLGYKIKITNKNDKWQAIAKNKTNEVTADVIYGKPFSDAIMRLVDMIAKTQNT